MKGPNRFGKLYTPKLERYKVPSRSAKMTRATRGRANSDGTHSLKLVDGWHHGLILETNGQRHKVTKGEKTHEAETFDSLCEWIVENKL